MTETIAVLKQKLRPIAVTIANVNEKIHIFEAKNERSEPAAAIKPPIIVIRLKITT